MVVVVAIGVVGYFALPHLVCMDVPKQQKVSDCTNSVLAFALTCEHSPPYQFVLGLGSSQSQTSAFRGEIVIRLRRETFPAADGIEVSGEDGVRMLVV